MSPKKYLNFILLEMFDRVQLIFIFIAPIRISFWRPTQCSIFNFYCNLKPCYTYIIGHYNPSVWIIDIVSHTTYVVCVIFIHKWRELQFKVDSKRQIFWKIFHINFFYTQKFWQKSGDRKSPKKYFSYFVLMFGLGLEPWLLV